MAFFLFFGALSLFACGSDEPQGELPQAVIAGGPPAVAGSRVVLDGISSRGGSGLSYAWELQSRPAASGAALDASDGAMASFIADAAGEYLVSLVVSAGGVESVPASATISVGPFQGDILHVDASSSSGDGTAAHPFSTIQEAVAAAASGDMVKVAEGIYAGNLAIPGDKPLQLLGGYASGDFSLRDPEARITRIAGTGSGAVVSLEYSGGAGDDARARLDGFTIEGGERGVSVRDMGNGGRLVFELADCLIQSNVGLTGNEDYGGGVELDGVIPILVGNRILNNSCGRGGGLAVDLRVDEEAVYIRDNLIEGNEGRYDHGGGVYLAARRGAFTGNAVRDNAIGVTVGYGWGGGIIVDGGQHPDFSDALFLELSRNVYEGNSAPSLGGGVFIDEGANVRMRRELIVKNQIAASDKGGAGLYVDGERATEEAKTALDRCTIADNLGPSGSVGNAVYIEGGSEVEASRSVFWNNVGEGTSDFFVYGDSILAVRDSTYQEGAVGGGAASISDSSTADPDFADAANGDYHASTAPGRGVFAD